MGFYSRSFYSTGSLKEDIGIMAKGGFPGMGMGGNMQQMLKQAQKMQANIAKLQEELEEREYSASAGGGMVSVRANGKKEILELSIKPEAVDPDDVEMLQDMVLAAVNEVLRTIEETTNNEMGKVTGGMNLPF